VLLWIACPLLGALAGLLAGLLGVGGGLVVVPGLLAVFTAAGIAPEHRMRLAVGTSLATICFTGLASVRAHYRRGAVDLGLVRTVTPGILVGTALGSWLAIYLSGATLEAVFAMFLILVCVRMFRAAPVATGGKLPGTVGLVAVSGAIGAVSGMLGVGGGALSVPYLTRGGVPIHRAVGTSAAFGLPIALTGAVTYVANGMRVPGLPPLAMGYVHLPALVGIAAVSVLSAPWGAALAHRMPVPVLRRIFAGFLLLVAVRMLLRQLSWPA
jgi:uncharacterized membrane protein YfcA